MYDYELELEVEKFRDFLDTIETPEQIYKQSFIVRRWPKRLGRAALCLAMAIGLSAEYVAVASGNETSGFGSPATPPSFYPANPTSPNQSPVIYQFPHSENQ